MNTFNFDLSTDENSILNYLNNHAEEFISEMELSRRAEGRRRFMEDPRWAHSPLFQLVDANLVEADGFGRYRVKSTWEDHGMANAGQPARQPARKFIDPKLRSILERSNRAFDLSQFA